MHISSLFKQLFTFKSTKYPIICKKAILCSIKTGPRGTPKIIFFIQYPSKSFFYPPLGGGGG